MNIGARSSRDLKPRAGGQIKAYADNVLVGTYQSRGPRDYYFKCGVYSRKNSDRSEDWYRNIKMWVRDSTLSASSN